MDLTNTLNLILIAGVYAMSLNLLMGYAGQISVAHAAFGAVGGYTAGYLALESGVAFLPALLAGVALAATSGGLVALPALRLSAPYLILLTLAVATIILSLASSLPALGGEFGLIGLPPPTILGMELLRPEDYLPLLAGLFALVLVLCWRLGSSPFGRVLQAIRDDEVAARSLGKRVVTSKTAVFAITSGMAAVAGTLLAFYNGVVAPGQYAFDQSMAIIAMVIIGGLGNLLGAVVGAAAITVAEPLLADVVQLSAEKASLVQLLAYGVLLVLMLRVRPQGLLPEGMLRGYGEQPAGPAPDAGADPEPTVGRAAPRPARGPQGAGAGPSVEIDALEKRFGGIAAVDGLTLSLHPGTVTGLIGPNGAGKTTVFNLLTGVMRPDAGRVVLGGRDVTGWTPERMARAGMVRSFQDVRVFSRLSALDNVAVAVPGNAGERVGRLLATPLRARADERRARVAARRALAFVGLAGVENAPAGELSFGEQKLLALARLLATDAQVLLLDEPVSGVDAVWVDRMLEPIRALGEAGRTVCVVEHNLNVVEQLADTVCFMDAGRLRAQGTMSELTADARLTEVYFGVA